ncbi:hypothetical protein HGM15179_017766 [Zosterops borbonicus]|uniref:RING-type domain-containing protein n=1 Tax=Zosterops borbonicus TaxID=364589 RepID=A0A8K1G0A5_9PASS|nr:hypothetical protein HGM15179_017766 [Zosterops borbonicus]
MDWFHCSRCFRQDGARFAITTCGHILCEGCGGTGPCPVCTTACRYLPLSQQMRPEEKIFFKSPVALAQKHLAHISQVWHFQMTQAQLLVDLHRDRAQRVQAELEKAREELGERRRGPPKFSVSLPVTPQPRRQLSSQVVSHPPAPPAAQQPSGQGSQNPTEAQSSPNPLQDPE